MRYCLLLTPAVASFLLAGCGPEPERVLDFEFSGSVQIGEREFQVERDCEIEGVFTPADEFQDESYWLLADCAQDTFRMDFVANEDSIEEMSSGKQPGSLIFSINEVVPGVDPDCVGQGLGAIFTESVEIRPPSGGTRPPFGVSGRGIYPEVDTATIMVGGCATYDLRIDILAITDEEA